MVKKLALVTLLAVSLTTVAQAERWECTGIGSTKVVFEIKAVPGDMDLKLGTVHVSNHVFPAELTWQGLKRRVDFWGKEGNPYGLLIKPDGYAGYYDFTGVPKGEAISAETHYKCTQVEK